MEYFLKANPFFVANSLYAFIYTISSICVVLLDLVECSQKNEIFSFIIQVEKLINFFQNSILKLSIISYDFIFTNDWLNIP